MPPVTPAARFISVMKFRPLTWRQAHPFLVADRCVGRLILALSGCVVLAWLWTRQHLHLPPPILPLPSLHPRFEDITPVEAVRQNPRCDRDISLYGYVRGTNWKEGTRVHIAGVGDYPVSWWAVGGLEHVCGRGRDRLEAGHPVSHRRRGGLPSEWRLGIRGWVEWLRQGLLWVGALCAWQGCRLGA